VNATSPLLALGLLVAPALAQDDPDATTLLLEGDVVAGVGAVTRIDNIAVADGGGTAVEADTDAADTDTDSVVLRDGVLFAREGQALAAPAGASVGSFDALSLDDDGDLGWNLFLDGTAGSGDDSGIFWNSSLLVQEGDASTAVGLSPGTPYIGFFEAKIDGSDNVLVMASVDDPAILSSVDRALVLVNTDGAGNVLNEILLVREGEVLPGQTEAVADLETGPHDFAFNAAGTVMFIVDLEGDPSVDGAVYLGGGVVAQEGSPSPVPGRAWESLGSAEVGLAGNGDWVLHGTLDGDSATDDLITTNHGVVVQQGDVLPDTGGFALTSFGSGPVHIGDTGNVLWYGDWADPDTSADTGLFLNDFLLVQEGVTTVGGYTMSPDGRWVVYEAVLADGDEVAVRVHVGPWSFLGEGLAGLGGLTPKLRGRGTVEGGSTVTLELTQARPLATTNLVIGISELGAPFKGGTMVPDVDILLAGLPLDATGSLTVSFPFPPGVPAGVALWCQHWINDPAGPVGYAASNAVKSTTP